MKRIVLMAIAAIMTLSASAASVSHNHETAVEKKAKKTKRKMPASRRRLVRNFIFFISYR